MKKKSILALVMLAAVAGIIWSWSYYAANKGFTPWMSLSELNQWQVQFDTTPPGGHPNYWDKGHWMNAVEARWHEGIPQYRVRYGPVPEGFDGAWYWYANLDQATFSAHVHELADKGFVLCDPNSYLRPDDSRRYQGVWHKLLPRKMRCRPLPIHHNS
jgi:Bacterial tandem repeat domain 1